MLIKTKLFKRLFFVYSIIIFASLSSLSIFFINKITKNIKQQQQYLNRKVVEDTNQYLNSQIENTRTQINELYSDNQEMGDIIFYLNNPLDIYIKNKLDIYAKSDKLTYSGVDSFVKGCYANNTNIDKICLISFKQNLASIYDSKGYVNNYNIMDNNYGVIHWEESENSVIEILKSKNKALNSYYYSVNYVINPDNLQKVGMIVFTYRMDELDQIYKGYDIDQNELIVMSNEGEVIYDSSQKYVNKFYPYFSKIGSGSESIKLDTPSYVDFKPNTAGLIILSIIPESSILNRTKIFIETIIIAVTALIILSEIIVYLKIKKLERRTMNIVNAIDNVKQGDFKTSIPIEKEDDEINLIAQSFNTMCCTLDEYIKKVYLSEIKQKNTEIIALQNQINPHFLYNTLESIRMKAIINGDKEVGRMLYNLATLFRNVVKAKNIVTIGQEIEYCKMYLDLYKFRYEDKFQYEIDFEFELLNKQIIKFIFQPIIENFLIHGMDLGITDNFLMIKGRKSQEDIIITIEDNGKGLEEEQIRKLNESIKSPSETKNSIGLANVHERIVLVYGEQYGLEVMEGMERGIKVMIKIPDKEVEEFVQSNVG